MATEKKKDRDPRTVVVKNARLSFPHIYKPQEQENDDGTKRESYNAVLMIPKEDNPHLKDVLGLMKAAAIAAKKRAWGDDEKNWPKIPASMTCFKDGDKEDHFQTPRSEYEGHYIISCSSPVDRPPRVITNRKGSDNKWLDAEPGRKGSPYAGCYVNGIIEVYGQKKDPKRKMPNRINASFSTIQFLRDGEPFANRGADPDDMLDEDDVSYEGDLDDDYGHEEEDDDSLI
ncbi:DUF2815 domain-containing protein [Synechococcus virus S-ESS1]|uniref:DUF2815 domain-containing protein n=1 Tax=Synechococcus virus S-ESS1 TaxID=1964565 RepID=A0A1V0DX20_9CAUD|nr:DUF2815 domain-containing protein [Synechococcus virus S-ESS1]ARB05698.1 DUF2815 domain-containing protein [Synechococcus virus S-ESS1]